MSPNYKNNEVYLLNKSAFNIEAPKRGEVVAISLPGSPTERLIKRVVGLPGEVVMIQNGQVYVDNKLLVEPYIANDTLTLPEETVSLGSDQYFVLGDNRSVSSDSRYWGPITRQDIVGAVEGRILN